MHTPIPILGIVILFHVLTLNFHFDLIYNYLFFTTL